MVETRMSGNAYVPTILKETDELLEKPRPTKILQARNCGHVATICTDCAHEWERDFKVLYERTAGGRLLKATKKPGS
jgi:hypothetical protein